MAKNQPSEMKKVEMPKTEAEKFWEEYKMLAKKYGLDFASQVYLDDGIVKVRMTLVELKQDAKSSL